MFVRRLSLCAVVLLAASGFLALAACDDPPSGGTSSSVGSGGSGGVECPMGPQPIFTITITAADGPVPPDTSVAITWSAGPEPVFELDDSATWKTLEQGTNVVCDINPNKPPPKDLTELVCRLWTSGATKVVISADKYLSHTETLVPIVSERCEGPIPTDAMIQLLPDIDAGSPL